MFLTLVVAAAVPHRASAEGTVPPAGTADDAPRHALVVTIDGLGWERYRTARRAMPHLAGLAKRGASGPIESVFPSLTWPAHTTIVTGVGPDRHGVVGNRFWDREVRRAVQAWDLPKDALLRVPTLYDAAHAAGLSVGALLWPATSGAASLDWNIPEVYGSKAIAVGSTPGLVAALAAAGVPTRWLGLLSSEEQFLLDSFTRDAAVHLVATHRPRLLLVHFVAYDTLAHRFGPASGEALWGLELDDRYLGDVLAAYDRAGLRAQTDVFVLSDHGFLPVDKAVHPRRLVDRLKIAREARAAIEWLVNGHALWIWRTGPSAPTVDQLAKALAKQPEVERVLQAETFPKHGLARPADEARMPDVIAVVRPGVLLWDSTRRRAEGPPHYLGMHGYWPSAPGLLGVFAADGPDIARRARPKDLRLVDVAPTIARIFALTLRGPLAGRVREDILRL